MHGRERYDIAISDRVVNGLEERVLNGVFGGETREMGWGKASFIALPDAIKHIRKHIVQG